MTKAPLKKCNWPGCRTLIDFRQRLCTKHVKQDRKECDNRRGTAARRGYGGWWRRERQEYLKENPLCVECKKKGKLIEATVVDHIIPHKGDVKLFKDRSNWQSLCTRHHNIKTAKEDGGFGNIGGPAQKSTT